MKQKIYLAGPIRGHEAIYRIKFRDAAEEIEKIGYIALNPAVLPEGMSQADYMRICFAMIQSADEVVLLGGWETSHGAVLEEKYARYIGVDTTPIDKFLSIQRTEPPKQATQQSRVERMFGPDWKKQMGSKSPSAQFSPDDRSSQESRPTPAAYTGFLLTVCPSCGKVRGFCARQPVSETQCSCGHTISLAQQSMIPAHINCEKCGSHFKYKTNATAETISYHCLNCEAPVDLTLNKRADTYITVGGGH